MSTVINTFLGAFAKLLKATVSFVLSVRPHGTNQIPLTMKSDI